MWKGDYKGTKYQDKGEVVEVDPGHRLVVTHFSPMTGQEDVPENYHKMTYVLESHDDRTHVTLTQDNNGSAEEAQHSGDNWSAMLTGLKDIVEGG